MHLVVQNGYLQNVFIVSNDQHPFVRAVHRITDAFNVPI